MDFELFSDIDDNFSISLMENGEMVKAIETHPKTGLKMDRATALDLAEELCNVKVPKNKIEFFQFMQEDDYEKFAIAKGEITRMMANDSEVSTDNRAFYTILLKMDMLPDITFTEKEMETLTKFCKVYNLSVMPSYEEE